MKNNELFKEYHFALVKLVVFVPYKDTSLAPKLVSATITLMTNDREKISRPEKAIREKIESNGGTLYFDFFVTSVDDAIALYRSGNGQLEDRIPLNNEEVKKPDSDPIVISGLTDFPVWPIIGVDVGSDYMLSNSNLSESIPFKYKALKRYHRRLTADSEWDISNNESLGYKIINSPRALEFLEQNLGIDFLRFYEYLGGMCLIVPDFQIMKFKMFVEPNKDNTESIIVQLLPIKGRKLNDLSIIITGVQEGVLTVADKLPVGNSGLVKLKTTGSVHSSGMMILHDKYGVVFNKPITPFMRNMSFAINVKEQKQAVNAPLTNKSNSNSFAYSAYITQSTGVSTLGDKLNEVQDKVSNAKFNRFLLKNSEKFGQKWFGNNERVEALEYLHKIIKKSKSKLVIIDPYFSATQVNQFLYKIEAKSVKVEILTTKKAVGNIECATSLNKSLKELHSIKKIDVPTVLVSKNKSSDFHDRFLVVDSQVWLLGSSLNMIGNQPTIILRVPDSSMILDYIEQFKKESISLLEYVSMLESNMGDSANG